MIIKLVGPTSSPLERFAFPFNPTAPPSTVVHTPSKASSRVKTASIPTTTTPTTTM